MRLKNISVKSNAQNFFSFSAIERAQHKNFRFKRLCEEAQL